MLIDRRGVMGGGSALVLSGCMTQRIRLPAAWEQLPTVPYQGKQDDIAFGDPMTGWYGNGQGRLYRTDNAGDSWREVWHQPGTYIRALAFLDRQRGVLGNVGAGVYPPGTDETPLYLTADSGVSWRPVAAIEGPRPAGICGMDIRGTVIHAAGRVNGPAHYLQSRDGGESWVSRDLSALTAAIFDVKFVDDRLGFIAGTSSSDLAAANGLVLRTEDGGATWRRVYTSRRPVETVWKLSFPDARHGFGSVQSYSPDPAAEDRFMCLTDDGGETWREAKVVSDFKWRAFGIGFLDARNGWIGGTTGGFATADGGARWTPAGFGPAVNKLRFVPGPDATRVYAIGSQIHRLALPRPR